MTAALGRVLAADVASPLDLPLFRNSQMDGYAVRAPTSRAVPVTLPVAAVIAAGDRTRPARPGHGGPDHDRGAAAGGRRRGCPGRGHRRADDGQVRIERARERRRVRPRSAAPTSSPGDLLLPGGRRPRGPAPRGAGRGRHRPTVPVRARLRVAVLTTGAELVAAGEPAAARARSTTPTASPCAAADGQRRRRRRPSRAAPTTPPRSASCLAPRNRSRRSGPHLRRRVDGRLRGGHARLLDAARRLVRPRRDATGRTAGH